MLKLLYQLSSDERAKALFAHTEAVPVVMQMAIHFPGDMLGRELAALAVTPPLCTRSFLSCNGSLMQRLTCKGSLVQRLSPPCAPSFSKNYLSRALQTPPPPCTLRTMPPSSRILSGS